MLQYAPFHVVHPKREVTQETKEANVDVAADSVNWSPKQITFTLNPLNILYLSYIYLDY